MAVRTFLKPLKNQAVLLGVIPGSFICSAGDTFIWTDPDIRVLEVTVGNGYVMVELVEFILVSCYFSPNKTENEYDEYLKRLESCIANKNKHIVIAGDMNAKCILFGSWNENNKGRILQEFVMVHQLVPLNVGNVPTFQNRNGSSLIDVTMVSENGSNRITDWMVETEQNSYSEHYYITFSILCGDAVRIL